MQATTFGLYLLYCAIQIKIKDEHETIIKQINARKNLGQRNYMDKRANEYYIMTANERCLRKRINKANIYIVKLYIKYKCK